jgi:hypothetical protein
MVGGTRLGELAMKLKILSFISVLLMSTVFFTQAADAKRRDYSQRLTQVTQFAGSEVPYVRFGIPKTPYDWEYLGDEAVLIWHTRRKAYLVDLEKSSSCRNLEHELTIRLDDTVNDLDARTGYINTRYGGWCKMTKIRPVDVAALKKAETIDRENKKKS